MVKAQMNTRQSRYTVAQVRALVRYFGCTPGELVAMAVEACYSREAITGGEGAALLRRWFAAEFDKLPLDPGEQ